MEVVNNFYKVSNILMWFAFLIALFIVAFFPQINVNKEMLPFAFIICLLNTLAAWSEG